MTGGISVLILKHISTNCQHNNTEGGIISTASRREKVLGALLRFEFKKFRSTCVDGGME